MRIARGLQLSDEQRRAAVPLLKPDEDETPHDDDACCGDDDETNDETQVSYAVLLQRKLKHKNGNRSKTRYRHDTVTINILHRHMEI